MSSDVEPHLVFARLLLGWICGAGLCFGQPRVVSRPATVTLIAQVPASVGVRWISFPATQLVGSNGLRADLVVIGVSWLLGSGQTVSAECQLVGEKPSEAGIVELKRFQETPVPPVYGFLPRPLPTRVSLLEQSSPGHGLQVQAEALIVLTTDTAAGKEHLMVVSVTAAL